MSQDEIDQICDEAQAIFKEIETRSKAAHVKWFSGQLSPAQSDAEKDEILKLNSRLLPLYERLRALGVDPTGK